ncbi:hypothetical protein FE257_006449 [Aspergillus nanangensis]|uniref:FAD-binding domain-containing protein n=1 Tax=Aspergillus nanangensis TaxID=2582783 RepID=A0AAD4CXL2_ASPNN|nr:hypothetical protein FE257_006449 [Aspergillus nanangensis]
MTKTQGSGPSGTVPPNSSGIRVIVVGLGIGGLSTVIECQRDSIGIASNAAKVINRWGNGIVAENLAPLLNLVDKMDIYDSSGEFLLESPMSGYGDGQGYPCHRGELAMTLYNYALTLEGIEFRLGHHIIDYWESETQAGVDIDGERLAADCVIAADGVHSKARRHITGDDGKPHSSGYAMYRAWFGTEDVAADPEAQWVLENTQRGDRDNTSVYIGADIHVMVGTAKGGKEVFWMCTHKDSFEISESWSFPGKVDEMLECISDWPIMPKLKAVIEKTPQERLIDFKLLWRDPLDTWISNNGRIMLIGDAAHPYLPTSGQGASQAIEDAAVVAIALELTGRDNVKKGLKVAETLRQNAAGLEFPRPNWIFGHDSQEHAYAEFDKAMESINRNIEYQATNIPPEVINHRTVDFRETQESQISVMT